MTAENRNAQARAYIRTLASRTECLYPLSPDTARMPNKRKGPAVRRNLRAHGYLSKRTNAL